MISTVIPVIPVILVLVIWLSSQVQSGTAMWGLRPEFSVSQARVLSLSGQIVKLLVGPRTKYFTVHLPHALRSWSCSQTQANMVRRSSAFPNTPRPHQDASKTARRRPRGPQGIPKPLKRTQRAPPKSAKSYFRDLQNH